MEVLKIFLDVNDHTIIIYSSKPMITWCVCGDGFKCSVYEVGLNVSCLSTSSLTNA